MFVFVWLPSMCVQSARLSYYIRHSLCICCFAIVGKNTWFTTCPLPFIRNFLIHSLRPSIYVFLLNQTYVPVSKWPSQFICTAPQSCRSHFGHTLSPGLPSAYSDPRHPPRLRMSLSYSKELVRTHSSYWFATISTTTEFSLHHVIEHFYFLLFQLISRMNWQFFKVRDYFLCFWSFRRWQMRLHSGY